jgi:hypothetical protein
MSASLAPELRDTLYTYSIFKSLPIAGQCQGNMDVLAPKVAALYKGFQNTIVIFCVTITILEMNMIISVSRVGWGGSGVNTSPRNKMPIFSKTATMILIKFQSILETVSLNYELIISIYRNIILSFLYEEVHMYNNLAPIFTYVFLTIM